MILCFDYMSPTITTFWATMLITLLLKGDHSCLIIFLPIINNIVPKSPRFIYMYAFVTKNFDLLS